MQQEYGSHQNTKLPPKQARCYPDPLYGPQSSSALVTLLSSDDARSRSSVDWQSSIAADRSIQHHESRDWRCETSGCSHDLTTPRLQEVASHDTVPVTPQLPSDVPGRTDNISGWLSTVRQY